MKPILYLLAFALILTLFSCDSKQKDFLVTETQAEKDARMEWWREARFGLFIHWGLYAIPAGEWNGEKNYGEWIRNSAHIPCKVYDKFVNEFNPVNFDAAKWVKMAKDAGMKYIVITSKHHDGFCLFDSKYTDFDVMSTPYHKDILKQLADACHKEGIKICWYHSIMDWHHPDYLPRRNWEKERPYDSADFSRYIRYMKNELKELVQNYGDIGVLWFDGEWEETWTHEYGKELYNYVRNLEPQIIINNRVDIGRSGMEGMTKGGEYAGDFGTPEQEIPATGLPGEDWETCMTMNDHWGYNKSDTNWKSVPDLLHKLADIASKGGNFLLNVGPKADGTFPEESIIRLKKIGEWMKFNGEAIYETHASPFSKLAWGRCTQKVSDDGTRLYLHVFDWPKNGILKVPGIYNEPEKAFLLADPSHNELKIERVEDALMIRVPDNAPDSINSVVVLDVKGKADVSHPPVINSEYKSFTDSLVVTIESDRKNVKLSYTTDGTMPGITSPLVEGPVVLTKTALLAARCFRNNLPVSDSVSEIFTKVIPLPSLSISNPKQGLDCKYFEGDWDSLPDFRKLNYLAVKTTTNFDLSSKLHNDYYGFSFDGFIDIPTDGVYVFSTESDDGSELFIDDRLVVENNGLHGMQSEKGEIGLAKGFHKIRVEYFEKTGSDDLKVMIKIPGEQIKPVPDSLLAHGFTRGVPE